MCNLKNVKPFGASRRCSAAVNSISLANNDKGIASPPGLLPELYNVGTAGSLSHYVKLRVLLKKKCTIQFCS